MPTPRVDRASPPNQVIIGLSLFLTLFVMGPVADRIYDEAYVPYTQQKIDFNLRTHDDANTVAGPFEKESVMLYRFAALFYKDPNNGCVPAADGGLSLSEGDRRGLRLLYPRTVQELAQIAERARKALEAVETKASPELEGLEEGEDMTTTYARHVAGNLRRKINDV